MLIAGPSGGGEATFGPAGDSARRARVLVEDALTAADLEPSVVSDVLLVLSELVSNAIRHARTEFTVSVAVHGGTVRLEVFDQDTRPPALLGLDCESTSGRGLHIVAELATDWGWNTDDGADGISGKVVWAELESDGSGGPNPPE